MNLNEATPSWQKQQGPEKKEYKKPSVQLYGNLTELTQTSNRVNPHFDGAPGWNNRT